MPLSEHEQHMLDEIERALYENDPKFATSVDVTRMRRRRPIASAVLFVVGLVALVVGVIATQSVLALGVSVSVVGFLIMVAGVGLFVFGVAGRGRMKAAPVAKQQKAPSSLSERMEERLRRRFDSEG
jgi:hypothetical protein